jgi:hypothetical protein
VIVFTAEKLAQMSISTINASSMMVSGDLFHVGPTFSLKMRAAAIKFCEQEESQGHECLLVESATSLTIWKRVINITEGDHAEPTRSERKEFITRCYKELRKCIGPMATLVMKELVDSTMSLTYPQIVDLIAEQIPNPKLAEDFRRNLQD